MASAAVTGGGRATPPASAWALAPGVAEHTQGLVATGFAWLPEGRALLLRADRAGSAWLRALRGVAPVTDAVLRPSAERPGRAAAIAFTWSGLARLGLAPAVLASFAAPFQEGMFQADRARRLGDRRFGAWLPTVVDGGPEWSGNPKPPKPAETPLPYDVPLPPENIAETDPADTPETVHAILLLYAATDADAAAWCAEVEAALAPSGVAVVRSLDLELNVLERDTSSGVSREHFGFADGLSQPLPYDEGGAVVLGGAAVRAPDPVHGVPLGEFLLGFPNAHREIPPGPVTPADGPAAAMLPPRPEAEGFADLGRHGSYLVVRELHQDVPAFWASMEAAAAKLREAEERCAALRATAAAARREEPQGLPADRAGWARPKPEEAPPAPLPPPPSVHLDGRWLAERVVGRTVDGDVLCPAGALERPVPGGPPANDFLFFRTDPLGMGCPLGSHIRRGNPRDGLAPTENERETLLRAANNHRILRRARKYGPAVPAGAEPTPADRGLLFACLNTDIARQFEFVQQTWLLNADFHGLRDEVDPLLGPKGAMSIPTDPFRHRLTVETFVRLAGGEYFFLPGLRALEHFEALA